MDCKEIEEYVTLLGCRGGYAERGCVGTNHTEATNWHYNNSLALIEKVESRDNRE